MPFEAISRCAGEVTLGRVLRRTSSSTGDIQVFERKHNNLIAIHRVQRQTQCSGNGCCSSPNTCELTTGGYRATSSRITNIRMKYCFHIVLQLISGWNTSCGTLKQEVMPRLTGCAVSNRAEWNGVSQDTCCNCIRLLLSRVSSSLCDQALKSELILENMTFIAETDLTQGTQQWFHNDKLCFN